MVQFSKRFYFPKLNAFIPVCVFGFHLLNGNNFTCFYIGCFINCTKCPIPKSLNCLVFLHDSYNRVIDCISTHKSLNHSIILLFTTNNQYHHFLFFYFTITQIFISFFTNTERKKLYLEISTYSF